MQVHLVQLDIVWEDKQANHARVRSLLESAPLSPGDLIVLPELFDVGFTLNTKAANDQDGTTLAFLHDLADSSGCLIHGSRALHDPDSGKSHNCVTVTAPGDASINCQYAKVHPFSYGRESDAYTGGNELTHYGWNSGDDRLQICPAICYDLRFPELFRLGAKQGAQAFALGANWPAPRTAHWRALCIARAIENQAYIFAVNRTGNDPYLTYSGSSIIVDPKGEIIGELGDEEAVLSAKVDPNAVNEWRSIFPALNDMKLI